ncbi:MAG: ABC-F family ATP-binding cassette domain-containing protein [Simkaniaceae bacterium]
MIQINNVSLSYSGQVVLNDVSFVVNRKEKCGLVGRNGSGKTSLFRLIIGEENPDGGAISVAKDYQLGYLDQHIKFTLPSVLEEACLGLRKEKREDVYKAEKILTGLGFSEKEIHSSPVLLSGGYQLRLHLAKVLLFEPDCLLLDEPTNYLDILSIRFLQRFLKQWKGELILISHDREFMDSVTTHTLGIHRKKLRKLPGSTIDFFHQVLLEEQVHEKTRVKQEKRKAHLQSYVDRFGAKASKAAQAGARKKMIEKIPELEELKDLYQLHFHFYEEPFPGKKMLEAKQLKFSYSDDKPLIKDFSFLVQKGQRVAIIGKNGYGKSTLLRLIAGDLKPQEGNMRCFANTAIGYFGQTNIQRLQNDWTVEEEIAKANPDLGYAEVKNICGQMMFTQDMSQKKIAVLSGGEKSRVLLGKILARPCNLLLLDEPTHHLDVESIEALIDALEEFQGAIFLVTHSELILKRLSFDALIVCHLNQQKVFFGGYEEFLEKEGWEEETERKNKKTKRQKIQGKKDIEEVKSLKRKVRSLEKNITVLEKQLENLQYDLAAASKQGNGEKIPKLSSQTKETEEKLQELYEELFSYQDKLES